MENKEVYSRYKNFIGSSKFQHFLTYIIYMIWECINYTAYVHDNDYKTLWKLKTRKQQLINKKCYDKKFLNNGIKRCFRQLRFLGIPIVITLYIILLFSSDYYLDKINKEVI